jgi:Flp pilus assembly protein TadD
MRTRTKWVGSLVAAMAVAAQAAPAPTLALLPPGGGPDEAELGMLIQARASSLLGATGRYTIFHVKQILRMAELEGLSASQLSDAAIAAQAGQHLGAARLAWSKLAARPAGGWDLEVWVRDRAGKVQHSSAQLPAGYAAAIEAGANALAKPVAAADNAKLPALDAPKISDDAWRAYGRCYARIVRQPIKIESPVVLDDAELKEAVESCRKALELAADWESARSGLAIAFALQGDDKQAVAELGKLSADAKAHAFYWIARFWLVTRYESNEAGVGVLRKAVSLAPNSLLLRGYLAEHLNAIRHQDEALQAWQDFLTLAPQNPFVLARIGYTLSRLHRDKEAIEKTQAAIALDPSSTNLQLELASRLIDAGLAEQAIPILVPLATPDARAEVTLRLGYAYLMHNELDAAEQAIRRAEAQAQKPSEWRTRARAKYDLAKIELRRGHPDKARGLILDALSAGYKPYSLAREDKDLMVVAKAAELEQQKKPPPPAPISLLPKPHEASPFGLDAAGEIDPTQKRPPPPEGFTVIHFGS